jgi:hypothetical protein
MKKKYEAIFQDNDDDAVNVPKDFYVRDLRI